jgi:hypothetical protein
LGWGLENARYWANYYFLLFLLIFSTRANPLTAGTRYPPILENPQEQATYILRLVEEFPWLASTGIGQTVPHYVALQQFWLPVFYANPSFIELSKTRPDPISITVQEVSYEKRTVMTLRPEDLRNLRTEIIDTLRNETFTDEATLDRIIDEELRAMSQTDPRNLLVGLINTLPTSRRGEFFELGDFEKQLELIENDPDFTDQSIANSFVVGLHDLGGRKINKRSLLDYARELIDRENRLISLLRVKWFFHVVPEDLSTHNIPELERAIEVGPSEAFDPAEVTDEQVSKTFLRDLKSAAKGLPKDGESLLGKYVDRLFKTLKTAEHVQETKDVAIARDLFTLREVFPELAIYRGIIGGDCSTTNSYAFPFSPLERVFFVFNANGEPLRMYIAATIVEVKNTKTLYVHDIAGPSLDAEIQGLALHAIFQSMEHIGVKQMTLPTVVVREANAGQEPSQNMVMNALIQDLDNYVDINHPVNQRYLDIEVRNILGNLPHSTLNYDSPDANETALVFTPRNKLLQRIKVKVSGIGEAPRKEVSQKKLTRKEAFLRLLDLLAGDEKPEIFFEELGFDRAEIDRILTIVNNLKRVNLAQYYEEVRKEFEAFEIGFSENFFRKHARYFIFGHLRASDASTVQDERLKELTIQYVLETLKRGRVRDFAYKLIKDHPQFFNEDPKFRDYVSSIPVRGADNLERIHLLRKAGIDPEIILNSHARWSRAAESNHVELSTFAIKKLAELENGEKATPETLRSYAKALDNEEHESDEASMLAVKQLMKHRTKDKTVNQSLLDSMLEEETMEIAFRAAIALLRNRVHEQEAAEFVREHSNDGDLSEKLRQLGISTLQKSGGNDCKEFLVN